MPARLFSGLVQTGAWTCLDEFNRINIEVLSIIAEQVRWTVGMSSTRRVMPMCVLFYPRETTPANEEALIRRYSWGIVFVCLVGYGERH